jgi:transposase
MLGRHLDAIARYGTTKLFSEIAFEICQEQKLLGNSYHLDTTTLSLYGDYANYSSASPLPALGYSKDHRPDLKQVTLSLTQTSEGNIPLWFEALDGNSSDKSSFQHTVRAITAFQKALKEAPSQLFVMDAAFYSLEKLAQLSDVKWLTRVPAIHKCAKVLLETPCEDLVWKEAQKNYAISVHDLYH